MAINNIRISIIWFAIILFLVGCSKDPVRSTLKSSPTLIASNITPQNIVVATSTVFLEDAHCTVKKVFSRDNVRWLEWSSNSREIFYEIENDPNVWSFSIHEGKESRNPYAYEDYQAGLANQFNITGNIMAISPDNMKIVYSIREPFGSTATPFSDISELSGEMPIGDFIEKIYLKYSDHTEYFIGEIIGLASELKWSADSEKVAVLIDPYSAGKRNSDAIYFIDVNQRTIQTVLPYDASQSDYGIHGFSIDGQWLFIGQGRDLPWEQNLESGKKNSFTVPENTLNWWGYGKDTILIQVNRGERNQYNYSNSFFYWYEINKKQFVPINNDMYEIEFWRSQVVSPSLDLGYLAIIDRDNQMSVISLCKQ